MFDKDTRVITPLGHGKVVYSRMGGRNYNEVVAYSVALDAKVAASNRFPFPAYGGTVFPADAVIAENPDLCACMNPDCVGLCGSRR